MRRIAAARVAAVALALAALSGCSWFSSSDNGKGAAAAACPTAAILHPLAQTAVFASGAPQRPTGVAFYGILSEVHAKCERRGGAVRASLDVILVAERGPASGGAPGVDLEYFVAVTGPGQTVLSKRTLPVHIAVPADARRAGVTDHIEEIIPLAGRSPGQLSIALGFQQSPQAVEFYRHFRGR